MTTMLMRWPADELGEIAHADGLHIAPLREDGITYGKPTWIWSVAEGGELYVRAYNGKKSRWYQAAVRQRAGADHGGWDDMRRALRACGRVGQ